MIKSKTDFSQEDLISELLEDSGEFRLSRSVSHDEYLKKFNKKYQKNSSLLNGIISFHESLLKALYVLTQRAVMTFLLVLVLISGIGAASAQAFAPDQYKPYNLYQNYILGRGKNENNIENYQQCKDKGGQLSQTDSFEVCLFEGKIYRDLRTFEEEENETLIFDNDRNVAVVEKCDLVVSYPKKYSTSEVLEKYNQHLFDEDLNVFEAGLLRSDLRLTTISCDKNMQEPFDKFISDIETSNKNTVKNTFDVDLDKQTLEPVEGIQKGDFCVIIKTASGMCKEIDKFSLAKVENISDDNINYIAGFTTQSNFYLLKNLNYTKLQLFSLSPDSVDLGSYQITQRSLNTAVLAWKNNSNDEALKLYDKPCGNIISNSIPWDNGGVVIDGPVNLKCSAQNAVDNWWLVDWGSGLKFWSKESNLQFTYKKSTGSVYLEGSGCNVNGLGFLKSKENKCEIKSSDDDRLLDILPVNDENPLEYEVGRRTGTLQYILGFQKQSLNSTTEFWSNKTSMQVYSYDFTTSELEDLGLFNFSEAGKNFEQTVNTSVAGCNNNLKADYYKAECFTTPAFNVDIWQKIETDNLDYIAKEALYRRSL
jgi:hypothetical protein